MYHIRNYEPKTIRWWCGRRNEIDFQPTYQRQSNLWDIVKKQRLIDSIINGFDLPKFYLADFTLMNSEELNPRNLSYAVIDGKQRFEAILGFVDGKVRLADDFVCKKRPSLDLAGLTYDELLKQAPKIAYDFDDYVLTVMAVTTDEVAFINDQFIRLNSSQPLTGAEVRRAMQGPVTTAVRVLVQHDFFTSRIKFSTSRGQADTLALKLLSTELFGVPVDTGKANLDYFVRKGAEVGADAILATQKGVVRKLDRLSKVFNAPDELLTRSGAIPAFFGFISLVPDEALGQIRPFLKKFETERSKIQKAMKAGNSLPDVDFALEGARDKLLTYNTVLRSIDDSSSLRMRIKVLSELFFYEYSEITLEAN
jgi:hypothetical protein